MKKQNFIRFLNVPRVICCHLIGEDHSLGHRVVVGLSIMIVGVTVSKSGVGIMHYVCDLVGYGIHGIGGIPIIEAVMGVGRKIDEKGQAERDRHQN